MKPKVYGYIHHTLVAYAQRLRADYPDLTIRNATVFGSAIRELSRLGYIELVDGRRGIPAWLPDRMIRTIKRVKYQPIWMPGPNFPLSELMMEDLLWPSMKRGKIVWHHSPLKTAKKMGSTPSGSSSTTRGQKGKAVIESERPPAKSRSARSRVMLKPQRSEFQSVAYLRHSIPATR